MERNSTNLIETISQGLLDLFRTVGKALEDKSFGVEGNYSCRSKSSTLFKISLYYLTLRFGWMCSKDLLGPPENC